MPSHPSLTKLLMLSLCVSAASACAAPVKTFQVYPPAVDLAVEAKPVPSAEIVTSAQAAAAYGIALEEWGERGWRQVARLCRWAKGVGMTVECPAPPPDS